VSDSLEDLVTRLEKVNGQLEKKETVPLRQEQNELMRNIQQIRQKQREGSAPSVSSPAPDTVSGGTGVNQE
jgi:hypothetical protein